MRQKILRISKARNNAAHASLQSYFDRISHSLEDRLSEYVQMKKYVRIYGESKKLLEIEKAVNIAAGSIYEINIDKRLDTNSMKQLLKLLEEKTKELTGLIRNKPKTLQFKFVHQVIKSIHIVMNNLIQINKNINRVNELIPIIKALLKMPDKESNYDNNAILLEINNALSVSITEPNLTEIKNGLTKERIDLAQYDARLLFEHMNDVSDKLIGLLNDKLLLIIGISEFLIAGVDDDGANDVTAMQRLPDELRVLFLASSLFDIIYRIKQIRANIKGIFNNIKLCLQIMNSERLESQYQGALKGGTPSVYELLASNTPRLLQRIKKSIIETAPGLDALELKLKIDTLDLNTIIRMTYGLIYEKANKVWENPYEME
ncbi:hypothetical protein THII_1497 [Thioploca ingrica]|uniref:Uncharacterized protein n=1 Tax=Thioploca ingrica TaxID=40754 RepID=A0A090AFH4_9GAMM|nr:hypothetical protein THII_1497 [Thioploca ingrica]